MLLKLFQAGQPVLRKPSAKLTREKLASKPVQELIDLMIGTLRDAPGVGLAAPQVGEKLQIVIIEDTAENQEPVPKKLLADQRREPIDLLILVNPELSVLGEDTTVFFEGCLSVDGYVAAVPRAERVSVKAWDRHGKPVAYEASGWHARILQHETDHLKGTLYLDRMLKESFMTIKNFSLLWRKALQADIEKTFRPS